MPTSAGASSAANAEAGRGERLAADAVAGDRRALARLLTEVENRTPAGEAGMRAIYGRAGHAHLVGITGAPGASTQEIIEFVRGAVPER